MPLEIYVLMALKSSAQYKKFTRIYIKPQKKKRLNHQEEKKILREEKNEVE